MIDREQRERAKALRAEQLVRELTPEEVAEAVRLLREDRFSAAPVKKAAKPRTKKAETTV